MNDKRKDLRVVLLSGGVGGARMARGLAAVCENLTVVVNVGDDEVIYGLHVSPDLDTVLYTLAGLEGPHGWGRAGDTFVVMEQIGAFGVDNRFRIGDRDLATNLHRTIQLAAGVSLSSITRDLAKYLSVGPSIIPATDELVPTRIRSDDTWLSFQEYFVLRQAADRVHELEFVNAAQATPAPGVLSAIADADLVVIAPSNPPLSVWPILAIPGIRAAVEGAARVIAVSPLFGGRALKGPADRVMKDLGLAPGNQGVLEAYDGILTDLIIDEGDRSEPLSTEVTVHTLDTRISDPDRAAHFAESVLDLL